jgi:16S rRNA (cytosine967-C5)-methyltransferase
MQKQTQSSNSNDKQRDRANRRVEIATTLAERSRTAIEQGLPLDQFLQQAFRSNRHYGSRDRRFYADALFSMYRWLGWLESIAADTVTLLTIGSWLDAAGSRQEMQALFDQADRSPLADKARQLAAWLNIPEPDYTALIPAWACEALFNEDPNRYRLDPASTIQSYQARPYTWLRVPENQRRIVIDTLHRQDRLVLEKAPLPTAIAVVDRFSMADLEKASGLRPEVQDLASQCVGWVCQAKQGQGWWDCCAGSGGKSLHLAAQMNNQGFILATDPRRPALNQLRQRSRRAKCSMVHPRPANATAFTPDRPFDGILVDAPCSGTGTWARHPDARWRTTPQSLKKYCEQQRQLLDHAAAFLKPGGRLVYAVCSLLACEGVEQIDVFLTAHPEFSRAPGTHPLTGEDHPGDILVDPATANSNGMFISILTRQ